MPQASRRLLVVDDEPTLRLGFSYALTNKTTNVQTASSGRQALEMTAANHFDVLILDLRMPDIDGLGVLQSLRNMGHQTPIVLCSAALNAAAATQAILCGVVDFLHKPICPAELRGVVEFILHPARNAYAQAMAAARQGDFAEALRLLPPHRPPGSSLEAWSEIFTILLNRHHAGEIFLLEQKVRQNLNILAFKVTGPV